MARLLTALVFLCWLVIPAMAGKIDAAAINNAEYRERPAADDRIDPAIVKVQILLDRALFSPGEIDGKFAENTQKSLRAFAEARGLTFQKALTPEVWAKLVETGKDELITQYTITEKDVKGPFLRQLPAKMESLKGLSHLGYTSAREALAEKFHMSEGLLPRSIPARDSSVPAKRSPWSEVRDDPAARLAVGAHRSRQDAPDRQGVRCRRRAVGVLSGDRRQRGKADAGRHAEGDLGAAQSNLPLRSGIQVQGREVRASPSSSGQVRTIRSARFGSACRRRASVSTARPKPSQDQQVGIPRLRAADQLGRERLAASSRRG